MNVSRAAQRCAQPVVELRKEAGSYTYGVRAPRARGVVPPVSFNEGGFTSLAACLLHVAQVLEANHRAAQAMQQASDRSPAAETVP